MTRPGLSEGTIFACCRVLLGTYLALHFARLVPYAAELFSRSGISPDRPRFLLVGALVPADPGIVTSFVAAMAVLGVIFAAGLWRRLTALVLWYGWACLFSMNPFIENPSIGYVGWLLAAMVLIPGGEPLSYPRPADAPAWAPPRAALWGAWFTLALGYAASGLHKLGSPSWVDGSALSHVLSLPPLAFAWWGADLLLALPSIVLRLATWGVLVAEIGFPLLCWSEGGRRLAWSLTVAMHVAILVLLDLADLTVPLLLFHLFVLDPRWLPTTR